MFHNIGTRRPRGANFESARSKLNIPYRKQTRAYLTRKRRKLAFTRVSVLNTRPCVVYISA